MDNEECKKLFSEIDICNYYYIFRLPGQKNVDDIMMCNIESQFQKYKIKIATISYDMYYKQSINNLLDNKPIIPTIIYIKDKLRMGEYLNTKYIYLVHDDPNNTYTHTTAQSLVGRCCGYNKKLHQVIIYCDYNKIEQHYKWIKNNYDIENIPKDAKYIKKTTREIKDICYYH